MAMTHTLIEYQSLRVKGSTVFFFRPFFPLESLLFLELVRIQWKERGSLARGSELTFQPPWLLAEMRAVGDCQG